VATALMQAALETGAVDAVVAVRMSATNPLEAEGVICRSPEEVAACRGSKYTAVAVNTTLRHILEAPGRYALVGLPCHIQGLRLETRWGALRRRDYPDYLSRHMAALTPPRCRICPDALAELADVSVGDAWLDRFAGSDGVSDVIVRTPAGERLLAAAAGYLSLQPAGPEEMIVSQSETHRVKRDVCRGRLWLRSLARLPLPSYPSLVLSASFGDRLRGVADAAQARLFRLIVDRRYPD